MADASAHKKKFFSVLRCLQEKTDDTHGISIRQIIDDLKRLGIEAERKGIYHDLEVLRELGFEIEARKNGRDYRYHLLSRSFSTGELKLMVDAVQASRVITYDMSSSLTKKLTDFASEAEKKSLQHQVCSSKLTKAQNKEILAIIDLLHRATQENRCLSLKYSNWVYLDSKLILADRGKHYTVSPWALVWRDENYYLVAHDEEDGILKNFRVDKISKPVLLDEKRRGEPKDLDSHIDRMFHMFTGKSDHLTLHFEKELLGVMVDRFGRGIHPIPEDDGFCARVSVVRSPQFYGWLFAFGGKVRINSPSEAIDEMKELLSLNGQALENGRAECQ